VEVLGTLLLDLDGIALARAAHDLEDASPFYRGAEGVAHPGLLLRQANRALAENVALGPWIHVASDVAHHDVARAGDHLETRGRVARVYEKKGRGWVDLDVLIVANGRRPIARIHHTAIYRMAVLPEA
jgi:acyl dehydratase